MSSRAKPARTRWYALVLLLVVALGACGPSVAKSKYSGPLPDVVIVMIDTLRADFVDYSEGGGSPFLASLAPESVIFEDASSPAPWTLPSVASLVTGRHVLEHGVVQENRRLPRGIKTLAEQLKERGYATRAYYRNAFAGPMCGLDRGYDFSQRSPEESDGEDIAPFLMGPDGDGDEQPLYFYVHNAEPHDPHDKEANNSVLLSQKEKEFVKWYRETVARYRAITRRGYQDNFRGQGLDFDAEQAELIAKLSDRQAEAYRIYARAVKESDERIRSIVEVLKERGRWDQTLFIVMSDHGEEMGEHDGWLHDQSLYQEMVHVPLMIRFPNAEFGGQTISAPASLVDVLPTILGRVDGGTDPAEFEGRDWSSALASGEVGEGEPRVVSIRINERKYFGPWKRERGDRNLAVRDGKWKGIWSVDTKRLELYDTEADPGEASDVSASQPERTVELRRVARETWFRLEGQSRVEEGAGFEALDEGQRENLRELGYLGEDD